MTAASDAGVRLHKAHRAAANAVGAHLQEPTCSCKVRPGKEPATPCAEYIRLDAVERAAHDAWQTAQRGES